MLHLYVMVSIATAFLIGTEKGKKKKMRVIVHMVPFFMKDENPLHKRLLL